MTDFMLEMIGYVASAVILVSLLMSSVKKLRLINLAGSMIFAVYGFMILSYPTAVMNLGIVAIDLYYLIKLQKTKDRFGMVELDKDSKLFLEFFEFYKEDIKQFMDVDFDYTNPKLKKYFITRNTVPAGLFIGRINDKNMEILLDYTTPTYRDYKVGQYLYDGSYDFFNDLGVLYFTSKPGSKKHEEYLYKMGFVKVENEDLAMMQKLIKKQK